MAIVGSTGYNAKQGNWQVSTTATPNPAVVSDWITIPVSGLTTTSALIFAADRQIRFVPAADFNGTPRTLQVRLADANAILTSSTDAATKFDITNVANGGTATTVAWNVANCNISTTVTAVSDTPSGAGNILKTNQDQVYTFTTANFGFSDPRDNSVNTFSRILISTLPSNGTLKLNGVNVLAGDYILASDIASGILTFVPTPDFNNTLTTTTNTISVSPELAIIDNTTITSTLTVSGATANIYDLNLALNITYTGIGDLIIKLTAPDSTVQTLYNRTGNIFNNLVLTLDDEAATSVTVIPNDGIATIADSYKPANPLSVLTVKILMAYGHSVSLMRITTT